MARFVAEVELRFECESLEAVGSELRRLVEAAEGAGFELKRAKVVPESAEANDGSGWTSYGPPVDPPDG